MRRRNNTARWSRAGIGLVALTWSAAAWAGPQIEGDTERVSRNGATLIEFDSPPGQALLVELAVDRSFSEPQLAYAGTLPSAYLSGLSDGDYYVRVRADGDDAWSSTVHVRVEHHPLSSVWPVLGAGLLVFLATLLVLVLGATRVTRGEPEAST